VSRVGRVVAFDAEAGLGRLATDDGTSLAFHCTAVTDGSRQVEVGRAVAFTAGPAGPGRWEALQVTPLP
jgi:cold shock CspA family protein